MNTLVKKAVLNSAGEAVAVINVESKVRNVEIAGAVTFKTVNVETTEETWSNEAFEPSHFDRTFEKKQTEVVDTEINVQRFKVSSAKKHLKDDYMLRAVCVSNNENGDPVYHF